MLPHTISADRETHKAGNGGLFRGTPHTPLAPSSGEASLAGCDVRVTTTFGTLDVPAAIALACGVSAGQAIDDLTRADLIGAMADARFERSRRDLDTTDRGRRTGWFKAFLSRLRKT